MERDILVNDTGERLEFVVDMFCRTGNRFSINIVDQSKVKREEMGEDMFVWKKTNG